MSTSSLQTRNSITRPSGLLSIFSLSAFPFILLIGLLIALTGCTAPAASLNHSPATSTAISEYIPANGNTADAVHAFEGSGGVLGS